MPETQTPLFKSLVRICRLSNKRLRSVLKRISILPLVFLSINSFAQGVGKIYTPDTLNVRQRDSIRFVQKDAMDVITKVIKVKPAPDSGKLAPGKLYTSVFPAVGYALSNGVTFILASNFSFYTSGLNSTNLSVITLNPLYSLKEQVIVPIISSIWLKNNKINLLGDYRFYRYPSLTYGLGGRRLLSQSDSVDYSYIKVSQEALYEVHHDFYAGVGYNFDYHYNIEELGDKNQYIKYTGGASSSISSGWVIRAKYDSRTNINNPKDAFYANVLYRDNMTLLGSTNNWQEVQLEFRKYITLSRYPNNVLAFWSWNVFTFGGRPPYFDLPSTGWDDYSNSGRGYIQGRFRGADMIYLEGEYRFDILNNGLLGGVFFVNGQSVPNYPSNRFTTAHPGTGVGLRIKLNKFSDTNLCIDYGIGDEGSRGFFFNVGEVF